MIKLTWLFIQLLTKTPERAEYKDSQITELISDNARYHKKCYANFANTSKAERLAIQFKEKKALIKRKADRPSASGSTVTNEEVLATRSKP